MEDNFDNQVVMERGEKGMKINKIGPETKVNNLIITRANKIDEGK